MQNDRYIAEIKSIRKKYSDAVFELGKSKDFLKKLESEKKDLIEKWKESEAAALKLMEDKDNISTQLKEALEKINLLTCENAELRESNKINTPMQATSKFRFRQREVTQLKIKSNVLEARLKQAECGIRRNERYTKENNQDKENDDNDFEVEQILNHKKKKGKLYFLVRWKGFEPDDDSWEPEANLNCEKILKNYLSHNKI